MPVPVNIMSSPLHVIDNILKSKGNEGNWKKAVLEHFDMELKKPEAYSNIVSLNCLNVENNITDGQLVRFRGMVQDMFDPEYYMEQYQVRNLKDGVVSVRSGRYRDLVQCGHSEELVETGDHSLSERQCLYCVSPPAENGWVLEQVTRQSPPAGPGTSGTQTNTSKRSLDDDDSMETETEAAAAATNSGEAFKKQKAENISVKTTKASDSHKSLNLPVPSAHGKGCIVKLYDVADGDIKMQDLVEFIGVVSLDPGMAAEDETGEDDMMTMTTNPSMPPPSMVPRLHVLSFTKMTHNNPLLPLTSVPGAEEVARVELHTLLTSCLLGDRLAADYLLLHLLSRVYSRKDVLVLGKMSVNLHNMTSHEDWPRRLSTILSLVTTNSHYLPLTRDTLDTVSFSPRKDYETNRLVAGTLQLAPGTHLLLDETAMTDGQLSAPGVRNLTSLGNLITWQKLEYDFEFQKMEYDSDVPCLVMSEGRSMLPSDVQVMVKPDDVEVRQDLISKTFSDVGAALNTDLLNRIRRYITSCRHGDFDLTEQVMKAVQDDFVSMRQTDQGITVEDFHSLLVLGRLLSLSYGRRTLTPGDWEEVKRMEKERKERTSQLPARSGAHMANGMNVTLSQQKSD